jgi:hypothetical protein
MRVTSFVCAVALVLLGTITLAQSITYDFDKAANFPAFKTYAWVPGTVLPDELNHARIVNAVSAQLGLKGLTRVESKRDADLLVAYHAIFDRDVQINGFSSGWGGYRFGGSRSGTARTEEIVTGTLIVDLVDRRTDTIVWRGIAAKDIDVKADPKKRDRNLNKAAEKLFKNYPPAK